MTWKTARVVKVMHENRHGLAEMVDGRHVQFHELSVVGGLSILAEGDEVRVGLGAPGQGDEQEVLVERTGRRSVA